MTSRDLSEVGDGDIGGRSRAGSSRRGNHVGSVRRLRMSVHPAVTPQRPPAPARCGSTLADLYLIKPFSPPEPAGGGPCPARGRTSRRGTGARPAGFLDESVELGANASRPLLYGPADRVEDRYGVQVVPPMRDFAVLDGDHRDEVVVVGPPGLDCLPVDRVLKHDHRRLTITVNGQFVRAPQDDVAAVAAVELGHGLASLNPSRVSGNGNHILEDYVFGQEIEEVPAVNEA